LIQAFRSDRGHFHDQSAPNLVQVFVGRIREFVDELCYLRELQTRA